MAHDLGLNKTGLSQCIENSEVKKIILKQKEHGGLLGINSIPTYYINKEMVVGDEDLIQTIKDKLGEN